MAVEQARKTYSFDDLIGKNKIIKKTTIPGDQSWADRPRFPFGIFGVDFIAGGGIPLFATSQVYGPNSGGKTSIVQNLFANLPHYCFACFRPVSICTCKNKSPKTMKGLFVAAESDYDAGWAAKIGVNGKFSWVSYPETLEEVMTICEMAGDADDLGLLALDSIPALASIHSLEKNAEDRDFALEAQVITKFTKRMRKLLSTLQTDFKTKRREKPLFFIITNQVRADLKAGNYGDPETYAGAYSLRHLLTLNLRVNQISVGSDSKYAADSKEGFKLATKHSVAVRKHKMPVLGRSADFIRLIADIPERKMRAGQVDDHSSTVIKAHDLGFIDNKSKKLAEEWRKDYQKYLAAQFQIIQKVKDARK